MTPRLIAILSAVAIAISFGAGWYVRSEGARADLASVQLDRAADQTGVALAIAQSDAEALSRYQDLSDRLAAADSSHKEESANAKASGDAVRADLERGAMRLRAQWATCLTTSATAQAAASGSQPDAGAALRAAGAGDLVRIGAQCDADIRGLQRALTAEREDAR